MTGQELEKGKFYANIGNGMTITDIDRTGTLSKGQNSVYWQQVQGQAQVQGGLVTGTG